MNEATTPELYYWPGLPGRGELVRLVLEAAEVPYRDVAGEPDALAAVLAARKGSLGGATRPFAPPILVLGDEVLSQTALVMDVLGQRYGLVPKEAAAHARVRMVVLTWLDLLTEAHDTHHPIGVSIPFEDQRPEARKAGAHFRERRLDGWLDHFAAVVRENGTGWQVGNALSTADLAAFQVLAGLDHAFPRAMAAARRPELDALAARVEAHPSVAAYLASDRRRPFDDTGIFRRYPELDAVADE